MPVLCAKGNRGPNLSVNKLLHERNYKWQNYVFLLHVNILEISEGDKKFCRNRNLVR